jgi:hypothetical protein
VVAAAQSIGWQVCIGPEWSAFLKTLVAKLLAFYRTTYPQQLGNVSDDDMPFSLGAYYNSFLYMSQYVCTTATKSDFYANYNVRVARVYAFTPANPRTIVALGCYVHSRLKFSKRGQLTNDSKDTVVIHFEDRTNTDAAPIGLYMTFRTTSGAARYQVKKQGMKGQYIRFDADVPLPFQGYVDGYRNGEVYN